MAPCAKPRRPTEDEVRRRWAALDSARRRATTSFDDPGLVGLIRRGVYMLLQRQLLDERAGRRPRHLGAPDLCADSGLLREVFDLRWKTEVAEELPGAILMNPDIQEPAMGLKETALQGDAIFDTFRRVLPDFLAPAARRRVPLHRARWKTLWASEPSSVGALELLLAQTAEQALWALGSDPAFGAPAEAVPAAECHEAEVPLEDWMVSDMTQIVQGGKAKPSKTKAKRRQPTTRGKAPGDEPSADAAGDATLAGAEPGCAGAEPSELAGGPGEHDGAWPAAESSTPRAQLPERPEGPRAAGGAEAAARLHPEFVERPVVHDHYWGSQEHWSRPALQWCLPSGAWRHGRLARQARDAPPADTAAVVQVSNTFITVQEAVASPSRQRRTRSLSAGRGQEADLDWYDFWH